MSDDGIVGRPPVKPMFLNVHSLPTMLLDETTGIVCAIKHFRDLITLLLAGFLQEL
jgi:hypothetical protein